MAEIYQASGYGKSRTVHEMSNLVTAIPLNLRSAVENSQGWLSTIRHRVLLHQQLTIFQGAYPPRDDRIAEIFQTIQDNIGHELGDLALPEHNHHPGRLAAVYSFFGILFRVVREAIELMEPSSPTSAATFPSSWNAHLETNSNRSTMYDKVHSNWVSCYHVCVIAC